MAKASAKSTLEPALSMVSVRKKWTDKSGSRGSVQMLGQRLSIRIVTCEWLHQRSYFVQVNDRAKSESREGLRELTDSDGSPKEQARQRKGRQTSWLVAPLTHEHLTADRDTSQPFWTAYRHPSM